jgi:hypothetical protein
MQRKVHVVNRRQIAVYNLIRLSHLKDRLQLAKSSLSYLKATMDPASSTMILAQAKNEKGRLIMIVGRLQLAIARIEVYRWELEICPESLYDNLFRRICFGVVEYETLNPVNQSALVRMALSEVEIGLSLVASQGLPMAEKYHLLAGMLWYVVLRLEVRMAHEVSWASMDQDFLMMLSKLLHCTRCGEGDGLRGNSAAASYAAFRAANHDCYSLANWSLAGLQRAEDATYQDAALALDQLMCEMVSRMKNSTILASHVNALKNGIMDYQRNHPGRFCTTLLRQLLLALAAPSEVFAFAALAKFVPKEETATVWAPNGKILMLLGLLSIGVSLLTLYKAYTLMTVTDSVFSAASASANVRKGRVGASLGLSYIACRFGLLSGMHRIRTAVTPGLRESIVQLAAEIIQSKDELSAISQQKTHQIPSLVVAPCRP